MRKAMAVLLIFLFVLSGYTLIRAQAVPQLINYQGRITDSSGNIPADGTTLDLTFSFYGAASGETPKYLIVLQENVIIKKGIYNVLIGSGTITPGSEDTIGDVFKNHDMVYLGVKAEGDQEMEPRSLVTSSPYAFRSDVSEQVSGPVSESQIPDSLARDSEVMNMLDEECSKSYRFAGYTSTTYLPGDTTSTGGISGIIAMNNLCDAEYPGSRLCNTIEFFRSTNVTQPSVNSWILAVHSTFYGVDVHGQQMDSDNFSCDGFQEDSGWGCVIMNDLSLKCVNHSDVNCETQRPIVCCAPQ